MLMAKLARPVSYKTIFQIHVKPDIKYLNLVRSAAPLVKGFPQWETDGISFTFKNYNDRRSMSLRHNSIIYDQDSPNVEDEKESIEHLLTQIVPVLEIDAPVRFGYRRFYLTTVSSAYEDLVKLAGVKLLSQDPKLLNILPPKFEDFFYRVDAADDVDTIRLLAGPIKKEQITQWIPFNRENHLDEKNRERGYDAEVQSYPDVAMFADMDIFRMGDPLAIADSISFVTDARRKADSLALNLNQYVFSITLED
jgi:hypothetical protein